MGLKRSPGRSQKGAPPLDRVLYVRCADDLLERLDAVARSWSSNRPGILRADVARELLIKALGAMENFEPEKKAPAKKAQRAALVELLNNLQLYSFKVRTRGDYGCIHRAIEALSPEIARRLADGDTNTPAEILEEMGEGG